MIIKISSPEKRLLTAKEQLTYLEETNPHRGSLETNRMPSIELL